MALENETKKAGLAATTMGGSNTCYAGGDSMGWLYGVPHNALALIFEGARLSEASILVSLPSAAM